MLPPGDRLFGTGEFRFAELEGCADPDRRPPGGRFPAVTASIQSVARASRREKFSGKFPYKIKGSASFSEL